MRAGEARRAFEIADRRCRAPQPPSPAERALRALSGRLCGWPFWREDLSRALAADPLDPTVNAALLRLGSPEERDDAARRLVASTETAHRTLRDALAHLLARDGAVLCLDLVDARLSGWAVWTGEGTATLAVESGPHAHALPLVPQSLPFLPPGALGALVEAILPFETGGHARLRRGETEATAVPLFARSRRLSPRPMVGVPAVLPARAPQAILVPAYRGFEATRDCLRSAVAEISATPGARLVVVEDASPDANLSRLLAAMAERGIVELVRNEVNLGFAGAVRRGLERLSGCDVLLLNADARLPRGALRRLGEAAYSDPSIGSVTPFSNNGEYASFPEPGIAHAAPSAEDAARLDAAAVSANAGRIVDLPSGTGFCLFLRHDALAAAGGMPLVYGRGYFEDMELCLRIAEAGFRNVCDPSVYVVHEGGASFGAEKGLLVARNRRILRERFPGIEERCAAFAAADPLAESRARLSAALGGPATRATPGSAGRPGSSSPEGVDPLPEAPPSLALFCPEPVPACAGFVRILSAALHEARSPVRLVVLGRTIDDAGLAARGNVHVAGPVPPGEAAALLGILGVRALALPPRSPFARGFETFAARMDLPLARPGAAAPSNLRLDPTASDRSNALAIVDWLARRLGPPPA